jgi:hypothetical protein
MDLNGPHIFQCCLLILEPLSWSQENAKAEKALVSSLGPKGLIKTKVQPLSLLLMVLLYPHILPTH